MRRAPADSWCQGSVLSSASRTRSNERLGALRLQFYGFSRRYPLTEPVNAEM
jgi:hypothetical protein